MQEGLREAAGKQKELRINGKLGRNRKYGSIESHQFSPIVDLSVWRLACTTFQTNPISC